MTNYRNVYKSDHLGVMDIEELIDKGSPLIFTIKKVEQFMGNSGYKVMGKEGKFNIVHFEEGLKPWVLNAGNGLVLKRWTQSLNIEDWVGLKVQLFIDPTVKFAGEITGGVKINPQKPKGRQVITPDQGKNWSNAVAACKRDGNLDAVLSRADITIENQALIMEQANVS